MIMSVTACAKSGLENNYCAVARPIYLDKTDKLSIATQDAVFAHDETWQKLCK